MRKAIKRIAMLFIVCGLVVSVSFGVDLLYNSEKNYQKLKAEMEEYDVGRECKGGGSLDGWCNLKNVIAFFDEIKATELKDNELKNKITGRTYRPFDVAVEKVREMPRFKNDSGIYSYAKGAYFKEEAFWKSVWHEWEETKSNLEIDGARRGYWKKMAE